MAKIVSYKCDKCNGIRDNVARQNWWIVRVTEGGVFTLPFTEKIYSDTDKIACCIADAIDLVADYLGTLERA